MVERKIKKIDFTNVQIGDKYIRMLGGVLKIPVIVAEIEEDYIWVGPEDGTFIGTKGLGWQFRKDLGTEVDEDLRADGINKVISYLLEKE